MKKLQASLILSSLLLLTLVGCSSNVDKGSLNKEGKIPKIPHAIEDKMDCAACHKDGKNNAKPTKHYNRPNCTQCHKVEIKGK